jgi:hypothetical protein
MSGGCQRRRISCRNRGGPLTGQVSVCTTVGLVSWPPTAVCTRFVEMFRDRVAGWRPTCHNNLAFAARFRTPGCHPLLTLMIRLSHHSWALDLLHISDYHGTTAHIAANLLVDIIRDGELHLRLYGDSIEYLNNSLIEHYQKHNIRDRVEISLKMLHAESLAEFPMMMGAGVKGACIRALVPWLAMLARSLLDGTRVKLRRSMMIDALVEMYSLVETCGFFFTEAQLTALDASVYTILSNYAYLADHHLRLGNVRYNIVNKHHYLAHIPERAASLNPGKVSTYVEESFVSQGARLYNHGAFGPTAQLSVLRKYLVAVQLKYAMPSLALQ